MNRKRISANWKQSKGQVLGILGCLTDEELDKIARKRNSCRARSWTSTERPKSGPSTIF